MSRLSRMSAATAVVSLVVAVSGVVGATPEAPRTGASWRVVQQVFADPGPGPSSFTAVTAQTPTSAWAFEETASKTTPIVAWKMTGSAWSKVVFPKIYGSVVNSATGTTPSSVYVATARALLTWSGTQWKLVSKFLDISDIDATGAGDLWVTGRRTTSKASGGLWHLDHGLWTQRSTHFYGSIDAASDSAIFSVSQTAVQEFDGLSWKVTSLAALLPAKQPLCQDPGLTSVDALTPTDVWVTAAGNCQDYSGPFRLLHFVRGTWSIAADRAAARGYAFPAGDGSLWIPTKAFACIGCTQMLHLAAGQLTQVPLPLGKQGVTLEDGTTAPGSTTSIAVGWTLKGSNFQAMRGVILRYGT
jgi:hypothetical protein